MNTSNAPLRPGHSRPWCFAIVAAWLAGAFVLTAPYNLFWRLGNGNLGHNILITLGCALLGIALVVPMTMWLAQRLRTARPAARSLFGWVTAMAFLTFSVCSTGTLFFAWPKWVLAIGAVAMVSTLVVAWAGATKLDRSRHRKRSWGGWMRRRWKFNGAFWLMVFLLLVSSDLYELWHLSGLNFVERASAMLGRIATQAVVTIGLMLLYHGVRGLTPKSFRPVVLTIVSIMPSLIVYDFLVGQQWGGQSLLQVVNMFTSTGAFDIQREVAASGISWTVGQVVAAAVGSVLISALLFWAMAWLSRSVGFRTANRHVFRALVVCWLVAVAEGALSHATKRVEAWQIHHKAFGMHVSPFAPPVGLETMEVVFTEPAPENEREQLLASLEDSATLRKPDIYVFMIESWRSDTVTPEVTPFISAFRRDECQDLGRTFAGSNCTPLSWFTFFHSRIALHWSDAVDAVEDGTADKGAYPMRVLDKLGYDIHVRAVCDLGYKSMGPMNFGKDGALADRYNDDSGPDTGLKVSEREVAAMTDMFDYLRAKPEDPQFHFIAFDSPHYNYFWPEGFSVLHENCAANVPSNLRPSKEVVDGVVRRYENSVNWIDGATEEFVNFLKAEGRYENSIIIITGDHGEEFQEEGSWFHCSALNRYQTEVPIIIKWPSWVGETPAHTNVSHLDVMPSVLDIIGVEPKYYQPLSGRSLLKYDEEPREAVIATYHRGETGIGLCVVKGERKAKFVFGGPWSMDIPSKLHFTGYTDLADKSVDASEELEGRGYADLFKAQIPTASGRFIERLETN